MKERFTPGEWVIAEPKDGERATYIRAKGFGEVVNIKKCKDTANEDTANAHLIASAPEMYRMLKSLADATVHNFNYETAKPIYELLDKARGEAS